MKKKIIITIVVALLGVFISFLLSSGVFAVPASPGEDGRTDYNYWVLFVGLFITVATCIAIWKGSIK